MSEIKSPTVHEKKREDEKKHMTRTCIPVEEEKKKKLTLKTFGTDF
jgi:hypothetical protein